MVCQDKKILHLNFRKSCLVGFPALLLSIFPTFAADGGYESEEGRKFRVWQQRYTRLAKLTPDVGAVSNHECERALRTLSSNEKPLAYRGEVYFGNSPFRQAAIPQNGNNTAYVGQHHANYVQRDEDILPHYEAFAVPQSKDAKVGEGAYARDEPTFIELYSLSSGKMVVEKKDRRKLRADDTVIVFDPGHGVDHAHTLTYKGSNSTRDVNNFTPQNAYYNRFVRMPLVKEAHTKGFSFKEIAIYGETPLFITRQSGSKKVKQPIPEGFVFFLLNRATGLIENSYYFPNFHHYKQEAEANSNTKGVLWRYFAKKYEISKILAHSIWGYDEIPGEAARRQAQQKSEHVGYRALSGRFETLAKGVWSESARNAFVRTSAIYRIERAAEFDKSVENMLQIAQILDSKFKYLEFKGTLYAPELAKIWLDRAYAEVKRKGYPAEDIFHFINFESRLPLRENMMPHLIAALESNLKAAPNDEHIVRLLEYFDEKKDEDKYVRWSQRLSRLVRASLVPGSIVINSMRKIRENIANTNLVNIVFDQAITEKNIEEIIIGFKLRAIQEQSPYERSLNFLEFTTISTAALEKLFQFFENGFTYEGIELCVDVCETAIKLSGFKKEVIESYLKVQCPATRVTILT
ncbi:MAG: hypothetical protein K0R52_186 [Alphaproteobacteria bacterium]|nr:hypothetical protein [Alphaproteobacteria bacterium]